MDNNVKLFYVVNINFIYLIGGVDYSFMSLYLIYDATFNKITLKNGQLKKIILRFPSFVEKKKFFLSRCAINNHNSQLKSWKKFETPKYCGLLLNHCFYILPSFSNSPFASIIT